MNLNIFLPRSLWSLKKFPRKSMAHHKKQNLDTTQETEPIVGYRTWILRESPGVIVPGLFEVVRDVVYDREALNGSQLTLFCHPMGTVSYSQGRSAKTKDWNLMAGTRWNLISVGDRLDLFKLVARSLTSRACPVPGTNQSTSIDGVVIEQQMYFDVRVSIPPERTEWLGREILVALEGNCARAVL